jgi:hypothetical protein
MIEPTTEIDLQPLTEAEVRELVEVWYKKLDVHAPMVECLPMLAEDELEMHFPEGMLKGQGAFEGWFQTVIRIFFDEIHTLKELNIDLDGDTANVKLVVNWQARRWKAPAANSEWLGFDAYQTWVVKRSAKSGRAVITNYVVDSLDPMEGSVAL